MFSQSGYALHARNRPKRPAFVTIGDPHFSHFSSVGSPSLRFGITPLALARSFSNFS